MARVRHRFVDAFHVAAVEDDAGRTGVDEPANAVRTAGGEDVVGADDVGAVVLGVAAADAGLRGDVEDDVAAGGGAVDTAPASATSPWICSTPSASSSG